MDKILVAYGTRSGRTGEIALAIGEQLTRAGLGVDVRPCGRARAARTYAAVVVVSALRDRRWEPGALQYLCGCGGLPAQPTRLVEWQPAAAAAPTVDPDLDALRGRADLPEPVRFRPPPEGWDPGDHAALWPARAFEDDHQQWGEIRRWAHTLAVELTEQLEPAV